MRRISSAPCISGPAFQAAPPTTPTTPLKTIRSRDSTSTNSSCQHALPVDLLAVQSTVPIMTIGQCMVDNVLTKSSDQEFALCLSTPSTAPDPGVDNELPPKVLERHIAYLERTLRTRRKGRPERLSMSN